MHIVACRESFLAGIAPLMAIAQRGLKTNQNLLTVRTTQLGKVRLTCNDDNAVMCSQAEATVNSEGEFTVSAKLIFNIVRSLPQGAKVEVKADQAQITVQHGSSRFRLNAQSKPAELQRSGLVKDGACGEFTFDCAEFGYLLSVAQHAINEATSPTMPSTLLLHIIGERLRMVGTNGGRMAVASSSIPATQDAKIVITPNTVADIKAILAKSSGSDAIRFQWKDGLIEVSCGDTEYQAGIVESRFVDYERVIAATKIAPFHVGLGDLRGIIGRMLIVSNNMTVKLEGRTLNVSTEYGEGKKKGEECSESMELPEDARSVEGFQVAVNGKFLLDAFNAVRGEPVHLSYDGTGPLVILAANGEARVYVMPVRV